MKERDALALCTSGDALYRLGCRNPYRAVLTAAARGYDVREIERLYLLRARGEPQTEEGAALLAAFDAIVMECTARIDALAEERERGR